MKMRREPKRFTINNQLNTKEDSNRGNERQKYKIKRKKNSKMAEILPYQ